MIHNAIQRFTDLQRAVKVTFGLDAGSGGLERVSETIQPVRDMWAVPEDAFARGDRPCFGSAEVVAGGAGNFSAVSLSILETGWALTTAGIWISPAANCDVFITNTREAIVTLGSRGFRDSRVSGTVVGLVQYKNNSAVLPTTATMRFKALANATLFIEAPFSLFAGDGFPAITVWCGVANTALVVTFAWRERRQLPGELLR